jgi:hypothetical protein
MTTANLPDRPLPEPAAEAVVQERIRAAEAKLTGYQAAAAELRHIADALDALPPTDAKPFLSLSIVPEKTPEAIDAVALAVLGKKGTTVHEGGTTYRHRTEGDVLAPVYVNIGATVPGPPDERDAELERLRAEIAAQQRELREQQRELRDLRPLFDPVAGDQPTREETDESVVHFMQSATAAAAACGASPAFPVGLRVTRKWTDVTCQACNDMAPF